MSYVLKIAVVGSNGVGKSNLLLRYVEDRFDAEHSPTEEVTYEKLVEIDRVPVKLCFLDTAEVDELTELRDDFIFTADAFVLVYSSTSAASYMRLQAYCQRIVNVKQKRVPMMVVANKVDLYESEEIGPGYGQHFATNNDALFEETSALKGTNVAHAFESLVRLAIRLDDPRAAGNNKASSSGGTKMAKCNVM